MGLSFEPKTLQSTSEYLDGIFEGYTRDGAILVPASNNPQKITDKVTDEIDNILGHDKRLFDTFMNIIEHGGAELSENIGNDFETETELKVLEINNEEVLRLLELHEFEKTYDGYIYDVYLDNILDKKNMLDSKDVTVRIRFKIYSDDDGKKHIKVLCTLKKRIKSKQAKNDIKLRECFEKEFRINDLGYVFRQLGSLNLFPYRQKQKERISYATRKHGTKFDMDKYNKIPWLLEIESNRELQDIKDFMNTLQVMGCETSGQGSRKTFERYGQRYDIIHTGDEYKNGIYVGNAIL